MKSTAHVFGHPIHPILIPYPFALLSTAVAFDSAACMTGRESLSHTARHLATTGLASALVAAVPGIIDYFGSVPRRTKARRTATLHALCNVSALGLFACSESTRRRDGTLPARGLTLSVLGTGLLSLGGWFGGELIYHEHIGVADDRASDLSLGEARHEEVAAVTR